MGRKEDMLRAPEGLVELPGGNRVWLSHVHIRTQLYSERPRLLVA